MQSSRLAKAATAFISSGAISAAALFLSCSNNSPTSGPASNFASPRPNVASFSCGAHNYGATGESGTTSGASGATTGASGEPHSTQNVPIVFDPACNAAGGTSLPHGGVFYHFLGGTLGPIHITPDCTNNTATITAPGSTEQVVVPLSHDGMIDSTITVKAILDSDNYGNLNCTTNLHAAVKGKVSCQTTSTGGTISPTTFSGSTSWLFVSSQTTSTTGGTASGASGSSGIAPSTATTSGASGASGSSGVIATTGASGTSGASGLSGARGASGTSGSSTTSAPVCVIDNPCGFSTLMSLGCKQ